MGQDSFSDGIPGVPKPVRISLTPYERPLLINFAEDQGRSVSWNGAYTSGVEFFKTRRMVVTATPRVRELLVPAYRLDWLHCGSGGASNCLPTYIS